VKLEKRYQAVTAERVRLTDVFERRLTALRDSHEAAHNNHLGNDIRDVADEGVMALTSLAEFVAAQHLALVKKSALTDETRVGWLNFVHEEMRALYDRCAVAVIATTSPLPGRRERVVQASLDFLNDQSRSYISSLERKLAMESAPADARSLSERLLSVFGCVDRGTSAGPQSGA